MKALSIRQPWAWLIVNGYKDIENRSWRTKYRGPVLIHAGQTMFKEDYLMACEIASLAGVQIPSPEAFEKGGIVGVATITDGVDDSPSAWFFGPKGFTLTDAKPLFSVSIVILDRYSLKSAISECCYRKCSGRQYSGHSSAHSSSRGVSSC